MALYDGSLSALLEEHYAPNVVCAMARLDGHPVGLVANQPLVLAGALDSAAAEKAARFVAHLRRFNIPLVTLVDVPGFLPGTEQEHGGIVRRGPNLLYAYCEATVPRVQVRTGFGNAWLRAARWLATLPNSVHGQHAGPLLVPKP